LFSRIIKGTICLDVEIPCSIIVKLGMVQERIVCKRKECPIPIIIICGTVDEGIVLVYLQIETNSGIIVCKVLNQGVVIRTKVKVICIPGSRSQVRTIVDKSIVVSISKVKGYSHSVHDSVVQKPAGRKIWGTQVIHMNSHACAPVNYTV